MTGTAVVTLAHGRHDHLIRQIRSLALGRRRPDLHVVVAVADTQIRNLPELCRHSVVVLDTATDPRGLPLAAARNLGLRAATDAGCDVLIALDVDCLAGPTLVNGYADIVRARPDAVWSGPVTYLPPPGPEGYPLQDLGSLDSPHPTRPAPEPGEYLENADPCLFWSLSFALSADAFDRSGGFDEAYVGYGAEDTDFAQRATRAGLGLGWVGSARAYHQHHPVSAPPVEHLDDILRNARLYHDRWGTWPMHGWLVQFERCGLVRRTEQGWSRV
ncbi:N-acetylglucosaminyl-diphospho-decaprenol L-rhamnosyltransferase [Marmoricola sp. OAE513]|uniref:glycosyltransferase family 2 protein n=1 Tax=Marmoricola sp. OAE513 TaxID=2817894 RepID=UPI001AEA8610